MGGEHYDGLWLHFRGNFLSDLLEIAVDWMVHIVHDIGL